VRGRDQNYYFLLGVAPYATADEIKLAYRSLAKKYHPDSFPGNVEFEEYFKLITEAYNVLSNPEKRKQYDYILYVSAVQEEVQKEEIRKSTIRKAYQRRRKTHYVYSVHTKITGALFVFLLIITSISVPVGLEVYSVETHFKKGIQLLNERRLEEGIKNLDMAIRDIGLRSLQASMIISQISYYELRDYPKAINYANIAISKSEDPEQLAKLHFLKGSAHSKIKKAEIAKEDYLQALAYDQTMDSAIFGLAELELYQLHDYEKAKKWYAELYAINPDYPEPQYSLALLNFQLEAYEEALVYIEKYLENNPEDGQALYLAGVISFRVKQPDLGCKYLLGAKNKGYRIDNPIIAKYCGLD